MDDQHTLFLWILASGGFGALLGAGFGALVGAITWLNNRAVGTYLGLRVARGFETAAGHELSPGFKGAVIGGTDGSAFLGTVGILIGAIVAPNTPAAWEVLGPTAVVATLLIGGGILFGCIALVLLRTGVRAVLPLFVGTLLGAGAGAYVGRANSLFVGLVFGIAGGTLLAFLWGPPKT